MNRWLLLLPLLLGCPEEPDDDELPCERVGSASILEGWDSRFTGALSSPQAGDAYLANDLVQVVIQGPGRSLGVNPWGGNIIDADVLRDDGSFRDAFGEVGAFINLAGSGSADRVEVLSDGSCGEPAQVRVRGSYVLSDYINLTTGIDIVLPGALDGVELDALHPLSLETTYTAVPGESFVRVSLTATNEGEANLPWVLAWLAEAGITRAFIPSDVGWDLSQFGGAEYLVFAGEEVAYGMVPLTPERHPARGYVSLVGAYALAHDRSILDIFGYPDAAEVIAPGGSNTSELAFAIGADHASVVQALRGALGEPACTPVTGTVTDGIGPVEGAFVAVLGLDEGADGPDLARTRSASDGSYRHCLPPGPVRFLAGQEGRPYAGGQDTPARVDFEVGSSAGTLDLSLPSTGRLSATITDAAGAPLPCRLTVYGVDPSPHSYRLDGDRFDPRPPGVVAVLDSADGSFDLRLEPGDYDAVFTRGPEYTLHREPISVVDQASVTGTLHRVVDTAGFLSGDFHVHAQRSPDSQVLDTERVANMAAEGVEILVSTDHAHVTDYAPTVEALGLGAWMSTIPGQEITTFDYGHFNGFPLDFDASRHDGGALDWPGLSPTEIGEALLAQPEDTIFQVNHPRAVPAPGEGNYFNNVDLQFDADGPYVGADARDPLAVRLDADAQMLTTSFVAVEVMTWLDVQGLSDWFNFLNAGVRFTATGNSDTHTLAVESSGWPRNFVRVAAEPADLAPEDLVHALHEGRNVVSFGPFVRLTANGGLVGDTVEPTNGEVTVSVNVQAPPWIPFDSVLLLDGASQTVLAGGAVTPQLVSAGAAPEAQRLELQLDHTFQPAADTWLVVLVQGAAGLFPGVPYNTSDPATLDLAAIRAGLVDGAATAFAATNPIFIDADGDGSITPSHLVLPQDFQDWRWEDRTHPY